MKTIPAILVYLVIALTVYAHPGKTDKNGGHKGPNGYHYHNSGSSKSSPSTSVEVDEILITKADISAVQNLLKEFGYYTGDITGIADSITLAAADNARIKYGLSGSKDFIRRSLLTRLTREKQTR